MSYDTVKPDFYRIHTPDSPWHAGAQGWSQAPWPGWGENPNLTGPRMLAVNGFGSEMTVPTQRMALPGKPLPVPPGPVPQIGPSPPLTTEKKIPWALIGLAALVAVGGYFMLKPAGGRVVKSNGKMFARNAKRRRAAMRTDNRGNTFLKKSFSSRDQAYDAADKLGGHLRWDVEQHHPDRLWYVRRVGG